jgi:hypothetical protein
MSRARPTLWLVAGVVSLAMVASAAARVPKFNPPKIVTGTSIGGVKVGMTKREAVGVWGRPDRCQAEGTATWCQYLAKATLPDGTVSDPIPFAGFWLRGQKVIVIHIEEADNDDVDPKLRKLKTGKGIRIRSSMDAARNAYDIPDPPPGEATQSRAILKQGRKCTLFYAPESPYDTIDSITVGASSAGVGGLSLGCK